MREEPPDDRPIASASSGEDARFDLTLRPRNFAEVVGQRALIENLKVFVKAAAARKEPLDHVLFCGPPGLGKTSLAHVIAHELGALIHVTSGPALERKGDLAGILTNLAENDVLFIDEIHRMNPAIEENLYPAMESFTFDIVIGDGAGARALKLPLQPFTLIGATTRTGLLTGPLRDRFGIVSRLEYYPPEDLQEIVQRSAQKLSVRLDEGGAPEIARRARSAGGWPPSARSSTWGGSPRRVCRDRCSDGDGDRKAIVRAGLLLRADARLPAGPRGVPGRAGALHPQPGDQRPRGDPLRDGDAPARHRPLLQPA